MSSLGDRSGSTWAGGGALYPPLARSTTTRCGVTLTTATLKHRCWTVGPSVWNCFSYDTMCYRFCSHSVTVQPRSLPGCPLLIYLPSVSAPSHLLCLTPLHSGYQKYFHPFCDPGTVEQRLFSRTLLSLSPNHPEVILLLLVLICPHPFPETSLQGCQVPSASSLAL